MLSEAVEFLRTEFSKNGNNNTPSIPCIPSIGLILGSGLKSVIDSLTDTVVVDFDKVPHMPVTSVAGHAGQFVVGTVKTTVNSTTVNSNSTTVNSNDAKDAMRIRILCMSGRIHGYEGHQPFYLTFATRIVAALGVRLLILTNASGGCDGRMKQGTLMSIASHVNFTKKDYLADCWDDPRLHLPSQNTRNGNNNNVGGVDICTSAYSSRLIKLAASIAAEEKIDLIEGVYGYTTGPTYETPALVDAGRALGASAYGMSTVPEVMAGAALGIEIYGVSLITNLAAGMHHKNLTHEEVSTFGKDYSKTTERLIMTMLKKIVEQKLIDESKPAFYPAYLATFSSSPSKSSPSLKNGDDDDDDEDVKLRKFLTEKFQQISSTTSTFETCLITTINDGIIVDLNAKNSIIISTEYFVLARHLKDSKTLVCQLLRAFPSFEFGMDIHLAKFFIPLLVSHFGISNFIIHVIPHPQSSSQLSSQTNVTVFNSFLNWSRRRLYNNNNNNNNNNNDSNNNNQKDSEESYYFWLEGPCGPSKQEITAADLLGAKFISFTNPSAFVVARYLGHHAYFLSASSNLISNHSNIANLISLNNNNNSKDGDDDDDDDDDDDKQQLHQNKKLRLGASGKDKIDNNQDDSLAILIPNDLFTNRHPLCLSIGTKRTFDILVNDVTKFHNFLSSAAISEKTELIVISDTSFQIGEINLKEFKMKRREIDSNQLISSFSFNNNNRNDINVFSVIDDKVLFVTFPFTISENSSSDKNEDEYYISAIISRAVGMMKRKVILLGKAFVTPQSSLSNEPLLAISDHVDLSGLSPLTGKNNDGWGTRFPDMTETYSKELYQKGKIIVDSLKFVKILKTNDDAIVASNVNIANRLHCQVLDVNSHLVTIATILKHMQQQFIALITPNNNDNSALISSATINTILQIISNILSL